VLPFPRITETRGEGPVRRRERPRGLLCYCRAPPELVERPANDQMIVKLPFGR
jgi:hypothetical protein